MHPNAFQISSTEKENIIKKKKREKLPSTWCPPWHFWFKLHRQTQKPIEPIEGDMSNMAYVSWPADLHSAKLLSISLTSNQRFPKNSDQNSQKGQLIPVLISVLEMIPVAFGKRTVAGNRRRGIGVVYKNRGLIVVE